MVSPARLQSKPVEPGQNQLLALLPQAAQLRLRRHLAPVQLKRDDVLVAAGAPHVRVYFPTTCLASVVVSLTDQRSAEVAIVGREGFIGLPVLLGADPGWHAVICQVRGEALSMPASTFVSVLRRTPELRQTLYRYAAVRLDEAAQLLACNAQHPVQQRLARWLLMVQDRIGADGFDLTQDFLALMLAVRRPYLTRTAQLLQQMGCIAYRRGHIVVRDRTLLQSTSCEDYGTVRAQYARLSLA